MIQIVRITFFFQKNTIIHKTFCSFSKTKFISIYIYILVCFKADSACSEYLTGKLGQTVYLRKIGVSWVHILKNKLFLQCLLCLLSYCLFTHFRGEISIYLLDNLVLMPTKYTALSEISNFHLKKFVGAPASNSPDQNYSTKFDEWFC